MTEGYTCIQVRCPTVSHHSINMRFFRGAQLSDDGVSKNVVNLEVLPGTK